jgi:U3 small nucleolar RNA-associated protein 20
VLEFLANVFAKFPPALLDARLHFFLLPLSARLPSEESSKCRGKIADTLTVLLGRVSAKSRDDTVALCVKWMAVADRRMRRMGAQVAKLVLEAEGRGAARHVAALLTPLVAILEVGAGTEEAGTCTRWQEVYFGLLTLESALAAAPDTLSLSGAAETDAARSWAAVIALLRHRHLWVQKAAARVAGRGLARPDIAGALYAQPHGPACLALSFYCQLEADGADEAALAQAVKCLTAVAAALYATECDANSGSLARLGSFAASGTHAVADADADSPSDGDSDAGPATPPPAPRGQAGGDGARPAALTLTGLFTRMRTLASDRREVRSRQRIAALRWAAVVAQRLGGDALVGHGGVLLALLMPALYRVQEGSGDDPEEVVQCAAEACDVVRAAVGSDTFAAAFSAARDAIVHSKSERKRKLALQAALDPEGAAKRRMRKNERKTSERKRKAGEEKVLREAGVRVGSSRLRGRAACR